MCNFGWYVWLFIFELYRGLLYSPNVWMPISHFLFLQCLQYDQIMQLLHFQPCEDSWWATKQKYAEDTILRATDSANHGGGCFFWNRYSCHQQCTHEIYIPLSNNTGWFICCWECWGISFAWPNHHGHAFKLFFEVTKFYETKFK